MNGEAGASARETGAGAHGEVVRYYDQAAVDYRLAWHHPDAPAYHFGFHDAEHPGHRAALANFNRVLADLAGVRPGDRVLDAGCGLGGTALWLALERGASVCGITLVPSEVRRARDHARRRGISGRVRFELADFTDTPFADSRFDVAWALESLCHAPRKAAFYREMARLLRPGGRLVVGEYIRVRRPAEAIDEALLREWFEGWAIADLDTREEHEAAAAAAGFTDIEVLDVTERTRPSHARLYRRACVARPIDWLLHGCRLRTPVQHGNVIAALRQYQALRRGLWFYGIVRATRPNARPGRSGAAPGGEGCG